MTSSRMFPGAACFVQVIFSLFDVMMDALEMTSFVIL